MTSKLWKACSAAALAGLLVMMLGISAGAQSRVEDTSGSRVEGTWTVTVQLVDCSTGALIGSPFSSLLTFARGGTLTEATANPMFYPAERGPGHGVWTKTGNGYYSASSTAFITLNGVLAKTQKISQSISMGSNTDSFSSAATVEFFDPNGNLLASGCANATALRFK